MTARKEDAPRPRPRALSLDYWDTLYDGALSVARMERRQGALRRLLDGVGATAVDDAVLRAAYDRSGEESERWWREEHRGYTAEDRVRWMLGALGVARPPGCTHVAAAVREVDEALAALPATLLPGAAAFVRRMAPRLTLAITSDTGFASGVAQDRLLDADGLLDCFAARVYSCDVGRAKPHPAMFARLAAVLGLPPHAIVHVGDNERTDVRGALAAGMRAVRLDHVRDGGPSEAELVARSFEELADWLEREGASGR